MRGNLAELPSPANDSEVEMYRGRARDRVCSSAQHIFISLYGCKASKRGRGCQLAVSLTCDLETGSAVV